MKQITEYFEKCEIQYFSTIGLDGRPKVRPFKFMFEEDNKLWFCTSNQKEVYKELQQQPYFELCTSSQILSWMRVRGKVVFSDDISIKEKVLESSPMVKSIYKEASNPQLEIFYLGDVSATISHIGQPTVVIN